ncbi:hypothetical protein MAR_016857 [Mya arenaria]|uniref:Uncharacterized protein n=1 Tax=Mya arenaria TaxID=6604 RepID=A0ABY7ECK7_MYAAR|nr:hypothetical protein MAR_016857 [Mya arenaria]
MNYLMETLDDMIVLASLCLSPDVVNATVPLSLEAQGKVKHLQHGFFEEGILTVQQASLVDLAYVASMQVDDLIQTETVCNVDGLKVARVITGFHGDGDSGHLLGEVGVDGFVQGPCNCGCILPVLMPTDLQGRNN